MNSPPDWPTGRADNQSHNGSCCAYYQPHMDGKLTPMALQSFDHPDILPETERWLRIGKPSYQMSTLGIVYCWIRSPLLREDGRHTLACVSNFILRLVTVGPLASIFLLSNITDSFTALQNRQQSFFNNKKLFDYDEVPNSKPQAPASASQITSPALGPYSNNIQMNGQIPPLQRSSPFLSEPNAASSRSLDARSLSFRPRYLCFINADDCSYSTIAVSDYILDRGAQADTEFVFVSYTRMQFRVATDEEVNNYPNYPDEATREANRILAKRDREALARRGMEAALSVGKRAFWLDFECVRDADGIARSSSNSEDVYRICDIVRVAHSMIIVIGPPCHDRICAILHPSLEATNSPSLSAEHSTKWLQQWGSRLWTLPELLLCPNEYRIKLFISTSNEMRVLAKRNFAERAWADGEAVNELVNHYEGSAILTPLQLISIALECFARRTTDQFSAGDIAYAIMGLFPDSQRPQVNKEDSGFRAFARLAMEVERGSILERLLCINPRTPGAPWSDITDFWGVNLKDIRPNCYIADLVGPDAVVLKDVQAASICWDRIDSMSPWGVATSSCLFYSVMIGFILFPCLWFGAAAPNPTSVTSVTAFGIGVISVLFSMVGLLFFLVNPANPRKNQASKKARLIGIEGTPKPADIERYLWGSNMDCLTVIPEDVHMPNSSTTTLQRQHETTATSFAFTLVDTYTCTTRVFHARVPPVSMLICGQEGIHSRALLCSYDHVTGIYHREKVLRVDGSVCDRMTRTDSLFLSLESLDSKKGTTQCNPIHCVPELRQYSSGLWLKYALMIVLATRVLNHFWNDRFHYFSIGIMCAQPLIYILVRTRVIMRAVPSALCFHELIWHFQRMGLGSLKKDFQALPVVLETMIGICTGIIITSLIIDTWSWLPSRQASGWLFVWAVLGPVILRLVEATASSNTGTILSILASAVTVLVAIYAPFIIGRPEDFHLLRIPSRLRIAQQSAITKYNLDRSNEGLAWMRLQKNDIFFSIFYSLMIPLIALSNGVGFDYYMSFHCPGNWSTVSRDLYLTLPLASLIIGLTYISVSNHGLAIFCSFGSLIGVCLHDIWGFTGPIALVRLYLFILPFIWAMAFHDTSSFSHGVMSIALSLPAWALGKSAEFHIPLMGLFGLSYHIRVALFETVLLGLVSVTVYIRNRRAAHAKRARIIRTEYRDNPIDRV